MKPGQLIVINGFDRNAEFTNSVLSSSAKLFVVGKILVAVLAHQIRHTLSAAILYAAN